MSSNIQVQRFCEYCGKEFTAKTTKTKYCTHLCNSAAYKAKIRKGKIVKSNESVRVTKNKKYEDVSSKEFLSVKDAAMLLGCSFRTIYRLIDEGALKASNIGERMIRVKRTDINQLLDKPYTPKIKEIDTITEFYTVQEIEEKYFVKYRRLNDIVNKHKIPKTSNNGKLYISKIHIDRYFKKRNINIADITEWYTVEDIKQKYNLNRDQIYSKIYDNRIPKLRIGRNIQISKIHFDELLRIEL